MSLMRSANIAAIVPAAGRGKRMGGQGNKLLLELAGTPILVFTLKTLEFCPLIKEIIIPAAGIDILAIKKLVEKYSLKKVTAVVEGGAERQDSVYRALQSLSPEVDSVIVHDGARPLLTLDDLNRFLEETADLEAAVMAVPLKDTVKKVDAQGRVMETPPREQLRGIQTPQIFNRNLLEKVHKLAFEQQYLATDDASLFEWQGLPVRVVKGNYENIKVTTPEDILWAESILCRRREVPPMKIGLGYDVHALIEGRTLILGGVEIPHEKGLLGHSDADVLTHAVMDAILGACALGDIGKHFPDSDARYKGISSLALLAEVVKLAQGEGYRLGNLDSIIVAQKPKVLPYIAQMRKNLAEILNASPDCISIKATTTECLGFEGREEGISSQAIVCLLPV
ncbi:MULTISPECIES: 2-C-methyl-D-erythritol 4-phosphate cytidylyltransferase [unclassified Dehalobacter]|uniref:2-C-methyl-D-erythritol 4-phosphate cytidylyltransferase n=1 Tax=unclassified Dehalobacter TaxID=2635733 RepID=UPI000E6CE211|nr:MULTISPECIES: 2-C-methyl-D-erythritol 4-phosphate cytidylyltransferase [unclassified Dehalobacter]RJE48096.1 2-C-methyl-D-erythritol 2,4-cyclodiphosphate synthase [Dehalobacter sp. MCB1]TCX49569.1 bifunctional 2-C-methyl-D-erythritol 4-phosphate cytidylyltransferase/2-C-methyl-D-erythritol 2,4-cyclodiphosphate synthase [Dehalobacter sp. 14DCB1]TCX50307.1 bifunctional 2-C-methyl-D-erythritol 4-phosphate cytidylyltransferase/2-C-methyl-D-erythritol 2,4-cyclodiphosphate synthase [Dehalobacter sp